MAVESDALCYKNGFCACQFHRFSWLYKTSEISTLLDPKHWEKHLLSFLLQFHLHPATTHNVTNKTQSLCLIGQTGTRPIVVIFFYNHLPQAATNLPFIPSIHLQKVLLLVLYCSFVVKAKQSTVFSAMNKKLALSLLLHYSLVFTFASVLAGCRFFWKFPYFLFFFFQETSFAKTQILITTVVLLVFNEAVHNTRLLASLNFTGKIDESTKTQKGHKMWVTRIYTKKAIYYTPVTLKVKNVHSHKVLFQF